MSRNARDFHHHFLQLPRMKQAVLRGEFSSRQCRCAKMTSDSLLHYVSQKEDSIILERGTTSSTKHWDMMGGHHLRRRHMLPIKFRLTARCISRIGQSRHARATYHLHLYRVPFQGRQGTSSAQPRRASHVDRDAPERAFGKPRFTTASSGVRRSAQLSCTRGNGSRGEL
ncbi:MAG: hypothetical protein JWQ98_1875 [Chlorobi bacterium]|nr:hypothetical protein [Chlorobiota bacterium]